MRATIISTCLASLSGILFIIYWKLRTVIHVNLFFLYCNHFLHLAPVILSKIVAEEQIPPQLSANFETHLIFARLRAIELGVVVRRFDISLIAVCARDSDKKFCFSRSGGLSNRQMLTICPKLSVFMEISGDSFSK